MKKIEIKKLKSFLGSAMLANIIAIGSLIYSIGAHDKADKAEQIVNSLNIEGTGFLQNAEIINNGTSVEDMDYISEKNITNTFDKLYDTDDIIEIVNKNPNLHFSIIWSGSQEEYDKLNKDEMPPYVTYYISDN